MKNKYKILFLLIFCCITQASFAQNTISGFVLDDETKENLMFCTIALFQGEKLIRGVETDLDGYYIIDDLADGEYQLHISYIGCESRIKKIQLPALDNDLLENIHELSNSTTIDVIEIVAYKPHIKSCVWRCGSTMTATECFGTTLDEERPIFRDKKKQEETLVKIFPNPASDVIYVNAQDNLQYISISDIKGNQLAFVRNTSQDLLQLPLFDLVSGTYYLTFFYKDGTRKSEKFIKVEY